MARPTPTPRAWRPLAFSLALFGVCLGADAALAARPPASPAPRGPLIYVTNVMDQSISVIEPATGANRKVPVGTMPHNWSRSPDGKELLVVNTGSESVSFFDAFTGAWRRNMLLAPIPENPQHAALGPARFRGVNSCHECHGANAIGRLPGQVTYAIDGKSLWTVAMNPPSVIRVDRLTGKHLQTLTITDPPFPVMASNVQYTPDGKELIVLHRREGKPKLPRAGTAYQKPKDLTAYDHGGAPGAKASLITFHTPDGLEETGRMVVPTGMPFNITFDKAGKLMYAAYRSSNKIAEIDVAKRALKRMLLVGEGPNNAVIDAKDGKYLYAPSFYDIPADIAKVELATGHVRALLPAKNSPAMLEQDPDSGLLYAVISASNCLLEIDPAGKGKIRREFPLGAFPLDVLIIPESERRRLGGR